VTDDACPQHSCAPRGRACGEQQSPCPNRVRPVRPLDEAVLTTRETPPPGHHPEAIPHRRTPMPDDIGDVRQHAPRRQKIVPFVTGPTKQNRPDRQRAGDPAQEKWLYSAYGAFRALLFGPPPPTILKARLQNEPPRDQFRLRSPKISHPWRQDAQIN
jgi:hypothetical protein